MHDYFSESKLPGTSMRFMTERLSEILACSNHLGWYRGGVCYCSWSFVLIRSCIILGNKEKIINLPHVFVYFPFLALSIQCLQSSRGVPAPWVGARAVPPAPSRHSPPFFPRSKTDQREHRSGNPSNPLEKLEALAAHTPYHSLTGSFPFPPFSFLFSPISSHFLPSKVCQPPFNSPSLWICIRSVLVKEQFLYSFCFSINYLALSSLSFPSPSLTISFHTRPFLPYTRAAFPLKNITEKFAAGAELLPSVIRRQVLASSASWPLDLSAR